MSVELIRSWFKVWLKKQPSGRVFARVDGCNCPLAEFLKSRGAPKPYVGLQYMIPDIGDATERAIAIRVAIKGPQAVGARKLPGWAEGFVYGLVCGIGDTVTAGECMALLEKDNG